ncbi:MAG TPA: DUF2948 family protein [Stellaceae bacterium]|nr:DUF2948 family protein [Stellaceae bacterium]
MAGALKLRAVDAVDVSVLSTVLQDALVPVAEMVWLPDERRFALVANRFRWEPEAGAGRGTFERTLTGLCIDHVASVRRRGFSPAETDRILELLALRAEGSSIYLEFAGGGSIRLEVERIECRLDDLGEPWPTRWRPRHPIDDTGPGAR